MRVFQILNNLQQNLRIQLISPKIMNLQTIEQNLIQEQADVLASLKKLQGMTSQEERLYLYNYAQSKYTGEGEIVELGSWLGSSTVSLAMGLENNRCLADKHQHIHAFDIFTWIDGFNQLPCVVGTSIENKFKHGDCFLTEYQARIEPWRELIDVHHADLTTTSWESEKSIEYLFVDAMKSWDLTNSIIQNFFPYLIPGKSLVHHNDWGHFSQPRIHLIMYKFRDYFTPIDHLAPAMIFKYTKEIPQKLLMETYNYQTFSKSEIDHAFNYALGISPLSSMYGLLLGARILCWIERGEFGIAKLELDSAKLKYENLAKQGSTFANQFLWLDRLLTKSLKA